MIQNKYKESSAINLLQAIKSASGEPTGAFKNKELSLVGVYLDSPLLHKNILADPTVTVLGHGNGQLDLVITLKPGAGENDMVETLGTVLNVYGMGEILKGKTSEHLYKANNIVERIALQGTPVGEVQKYDVRLAISTDNVERVTFKLNGVTYFGYKIKDSTDVMEKGDAQFTNVLHLMFKEKQYEAENLFSAYSGETLNKANTIKFLDMIADTNYSGLQLGAITLTSIKSGEPDGVLASILDVYNDSILESMDEEWFAVPTYSSTVYLSRDKIRSMKVIYKDNWKYQLDLYTDTAKVSLLYG